MSLSAHAMLQVTAAKKDHDANCPWRKPAKEAHCNPVSLETLGWEDGDEIAGLKIVADENVSRGRFRIFCDGDLDRAGHAEAEVKQETEEFEAVPQSPRKREKVLI